MNYGMKRVSDFVAVAATHRAESDINENDAAFGRASSEIVATRARYSLLTLLRIYSRDARAANGCLRYVTTNYEVSGALARSGARPESGCWEKSRPSRSYMSRCEAR